MAGDAIVTNAWIIEQQEARDRFNDAFDKDASENYYRKMTGHVGKAVLTFSGNAIATETVVIGADTWTWDTNVDVGADADESIGNLVTAINGSGTELVTAVGDTTGDTVTIYNSDAVGGDQQFGTQSIVLSETGTNTAWDKANLNQEGRVPHVMMEVGVCSVDTLSAAADIVINLPFSPDFVELICYSESGGVWTPKYTTATIEPGTLLFTVDPTAGATAMANGDKFIWKAFKNVTV